MKLYFFCALLCFISNVFGAELPDYIEKCNLDSEAINQCLRDNGNKAIPEIVKGIPSFGIPPLAPLKLSEYDLDGGGFALTLKNIAFSGFQDFKIRSVNFNYADKNFSAIYIIPRCNLSADYMMTSGNVFWRTSLGGGKIDISLIDNVIEYNSTMAVNAADDGDHLALDRVTAKLQTQSTHYKFGDLYANIEGNFQEFLSNHWRIIEGRLQHSIAKFILTQIRMVFDAFSKNVPLKDIFNV